MEGEKRKTRILFGPLDRASLHHWTADENGTLIVIAPQFPQEKGKKLEADS
jgi:hypothetical protein